MEHFEYLYLLGQAHRIYKHEEDALSQGGVFHASSLFHDVDGIEAQLRIVRINPTDVDTKLVLRLRHPKDVNVAEKVANIAVAIFGPNPTRLDEPIKERGMIEHVFLCDTVPPDPLANLNQKEPK